MVGSHVNAIRIEGRMARGEVSGGEVVMQELCKAGEERPHPHRDTLRLTEEAYRALVARFGERAPVPTPSATELLCDFTRATARWVAQGLPVVSQHTYAQRLATCPACRLPDNTPTWDESARFGLGRCARCRCTNLKLWAATTRCPVGRW